MDAKQHAEIWSRAAMVVVNMDPRRSWKLPPGITAGTVGRSYSEKEAATWDAFNAAAAVLAAIAAEYKAAE